MTTTLLPVIQADRDAAADVLFHVDNDPFVDNIREGLEDDSYLVQAFARHRLAETEKAIHAAEGWLQLQDDGTDLPGSTYRNQIVRGIVGDIRRRDAENGA